MNDDLEKQLQAFRRAGPSAELDQRMRETFARAATANPAVRRGNPGRWIAALAAVAALLVLVCRPVVETVRPAPPLVYPIKASGALRAWLLTPPARLQAPPTLIVSMQP